MLHDMQQLVGSLQWIRNIILIPPEIMPPLYDLQKGKHPWEQKTLTPEASNSLNFIEQQISSGTLARWNPAVPLDLYVHFTKWRGVGALAQGPLDKARPIQWVVMGKPSRAFSPGVECLGNLIMRGRKLTLNHLGIKLAKIFLPFRKQLPALSTAMSEHLALALIGFAREIRYATKPPWTELLSVVDMDLPPKSVQVFASKRNITLVQGIPYNCTGQAIVERANQTLKTKLEVPVNERNSKPADTSETSEAVTLVKTKQYRCLHAILILGLVLIAQAKPESHPYRPFQWLLRNPTMGKVIRDNTLAGAPVWYVGLVDLLHPHLKPIGPGDAMFLSLNQSNPDFTEHCWLCYDTKPPFYEGIAINACLMYLNNPNPVECKWNASRTGITLAHITGQGTCVGNAALAEQSTVPV
ncbi:hypothetical protein HGM15179_013459 [Zosterops borbonicus]|uniref:Reverse transcriptase thumb domain-containing protein n=1 Tax=Zosterops borbonicus TaxID=364589 RepID=A0A8K1G8R4_9PASS|nr:hypothetical protein HGM15179_013459 [Zosterops borbonicus]